MNSPQLVLASASPRRRELLGQIGLIFKVVVTNIDESVKHNETPVQYVERLAIAKAKAGYAPECVVLGADTTVSIDGEILGKPSGQAEGIAMLGKLSGRAHEVITAIAAFDGTALESIVVSSIVHFREISADEAKKYWATGEPVDKAGGYGIQGIGGIFAQRLEGSYSAVVGLPLEQTERLLRKFTIDTWSTRIHG